MSQRQAEALYSIGAVAAMLGMAASTLRAWEDRYGVITPGRSEGSQRLYSRRQVEQLRFIKSQLEKGASAADAHRVLAHELAAGRTLATAGEASVDGRLLVLLADRDPYAAGLAEYFLRTEGYEVVTALDATQAKVQFGERSPHVVLLDLLISGGVGFRLLDEFVAVGSARVIAVSAIDSAEEAMRSGAAAFLRKPLEPLELVSTVRDLLGTSALTRRAGRTAQPAV